MNRYQYLNGSGEHMHTLDNQPLIGTSRVGSILAKPLTYWASGLAVQTFGCPDPKILTKIKNGKATLREKADHMAALEAALKVIKGSTVEQYAALIDKAYRAHATTLKEKATAGVDLHAELESFVKNHMLHHGNVYGIIEQYPEQIHPFINWSEENVKRFLWAEANCYSAVHWLGGISDCGYESNDGTFGIIDFKSSKDAYLSHALQAAGYIIQISENGTFTPDGDSVYKPEKSIDRISIFPFGGEKPAVRHWENVTELKETFLNTLAVYKVLNKYEAI